VKLMKPHYWGGRANGSVSDYRKRRNFVGPLSAGWGMW
jgi:hypothetical protein